MNTNKIDLIKTEVERIQLYTQSEVLKQVLDYIDEVQEEPVSEDLKKASIIHSEIVRNTSVIDEDFIDGAQWQKEQMMAKAINGYVIEDIEEGNGDFLLSAEYLPKSMGLKDRQKVKVIVIIKED